MAAWSHQEVKDILEEIDALEVEWSSDGCAGRAVTGIGCEPSSEKDRLAFAKRGGNEMASQKSRRRKRREAKGLHHRQSAPPKRTTLNVAGPDRLAEVGGVIAAVTDPTRGGERWARGVVLESHYDTNRGKPVVSSPWLTVYDEVGEQVAGMVGKPICLGGQLIGLPELDRRTQRRWHIAVRDVLSQSSTNMPGAGRLARNLVVVCGLIVSRRSGVVVKSREPKCDFVVRCEAVDGTEHLIDMTAYDIPQVRVQEWPIRREIHIVANVCTYKAGKHTVMSIVPYSVMRAADAAPAA